MFSCLLTGTKSASITKNDVRNFFWNGCDERSWPWHWIALMTHGNAPTALMEFLRILLCFSNFYDGTDSSLVLTTAGDCLESVLNRRWSMSPLKSAVCAFFREGSHGDYNDYNDQTPHTIRIASFATDVREKWIQKTLTISFWLKTVRKPMHKDWRWSTMINQICIRSICMESSKGICFSVTMQMQKKHQST